MIYEIYSLIKGYGSLGGGLQVLEHSALGRGGSIVDILSHIFSKSVEEPKTSDPKP